MAEIKNSKLLDYIIAHAKASEHPAVLTASRYLLSALDVLIGATDYEMNNEEQDAFRTLLDQYFPDPGAGFSALRRYLTESIDGNADASYVDSLYMQKTLYTAREASRTKALDEIDAADVLALILKAPDKSIRACLSYFSNGETEQTTEAQDTLAQKIEAQFKARAEAEREQAAEPVRREEPLPANPRLAVSELTEKVKKLRTELSKVIFGQDHAVSVFTTGYFQAELSALTDRSRTRPRATYLFAGPPGVGKTFLAETAAQILELPFKRFDMSEYADKEAPLEFIGSDQVYKNAKEGNVTGFVAKNPKCLLLFDEIEKAHLNIIHLFLQLLDAGRLRDSYTDKEVSFSDVIMIFTTNAGRQLYDNAESGDFSGVSRKVILKALQNDVNTETGAPFFPAAICSRFASGNVVMFNHMSAADLREIARKEVLRNARLFEEAIGIKLDIDEAVFSALLFAEGGAADARTIRSRAETFLNDELYELFRLIDAEQVPSSVRDLETIRITAALPRQDPDLLRLFENPETPQILTVASQETADACSAACAQCTFAVAQDLETARKLLQTRDIRFALIDMRFGCRSGEDYLNIEDRESTARDLFWFLREFHGSLPIFLLQAGESVFSEEERASFLRLGVRGILSLSDAFADDLQRTVESLHQQRCMNNLAKANKLVSFETAQTVSDGGRTAEIRLFDFEMATAVDAEDSGNLLSSVSKPNVSFDQVIGAEDAKKELHYFVEYLKDPKRFLGTGVGTPKGVLLYGPPGTGKTMLAKATATASDVTFIVAEGNQFLKKYVGEGPEAVHELFRTARKYAPSILFIDEIDAIAKTRTGDDRNSSGDVLTAFLAEMDGFKKDAERPVFVLAATNFEVDPGSSKSLDSALLRRFDRRILVDLPNRDERTQYLRMRMAETPAFDLTNELVDNIAIRSTGMSLADLASVIELALRSAIRDGGLKVTDELFEEAFETYSSGEQKHWDLSLLERVARHEAGHAFLCWQSGETPSYLTIVARGSHGGYMQHDDNEGKAIYTKRELLSHLRTSLGGRAAEIVYYGSEEGVSSGASGDLQSATALARSILCTYGMDEAFGLSYIDAASAERGELSAAVHAAVNRILASEMQTAIQTIADNRAAVDALVDLLLVKNHLTGEEISGVLRDAAGK